MNLILLLKPLGMVISLMVYCTGNTIGDRLINADVLHKILINKWLNELY